MIGRTVGRWCRSKGQCSGDRSETRIDPISFRPDDDHIRSLMCKGGGEMKNVLPVVEITALLLATAILLMIYQAAADDRDLMQNIAR